MNDTTAPTVEPGFDVRQYSVREEVFNSISHGVGVFLSIVGGSVAITLSAVYGGAREVIASSIYALSLVLLYTMSTLYHAFPIPKVKRVFRVFDHSTVFLLIAGTYTPYMLITLQGTTKGLIIFIAVWVCAIFGVILNAISVNRFARLSLVLYVLMGWCIILALGDLIRAMSVGGIVLLFLGGVAYTGGIGFYKAKQTEFTHAVWHLFVLMGSALHYLSIVIYVLPGAGG